MVKRYFGILIPLLAAAAGAQAPAAGTQQPATLATVQQDHAVELARLSDACVEKKLLNDADRLLESALLLAPRDKELQQRKARLRQLWISVNRDREKSQVYKSFWKSDAYRKACTDLQKRERKVGATAIQAYLEVAGRVGKNDARMADAAFRQAFEVDATDKALRSRAGAERMEKLRRELPGLAALQLGKTIVGQATDLAGLKGKVVLWRSFSL